MRQPSCLGSVGLIRDHNNIVALAVRFVWVNVLIELVDQAKDIAMILCQDALEVGARVGARCLLVGDATAHEGLVNLAVEVLAVCHQQEGEVTRHSPTNLLGEERHRIRLAAALGVPEHTQTTEIGMGAFYDGNGAFGDEGRQGGSTECPAASHRESSPA